MAYHGALTTDESLLHMAETTKAFTTGLLILMKTMMGTTRPIKAMESSMHSQQMALSGSILTVMDMETILPLPFNLTNALPYLVTAQKTDLVALMPMGMDGLTSATGLLPTKSNGLMQITMATATTICSILPQINSTSINEEMPSLMTPHNGTTQMVMAGAITTKMRLGILTEPPNGLV